MSLDSEDSDMPDLRSWVYRNAATLMLTLVIGLSSIVWQRVATSLDEMRSDIRNLTEKLGEVVSNQNVQREMIDRNASDIQEMNQKLREHSNNWKERWKKHPPQE